MFIQIVIPFLSIDAKDRTNDLVDLGCVIDYIVHISLEVSIEYLKVIRLKRAASPPAHRAQTTIKKF